MADDLRFQLGDIVYPILHPDPLVGRRTPLHQPRDTGIVIDARPTMVVVMWETPQGPHDDLDLDEHDPRTGRCLSYPWTIRRLHGHRRGAPCDH